MSVKLMGQVWELDLPHNQLIVALALADHGKDDGSSIFPSVGHVAWKTGYSDRQARRVIRELEAAGLLVKVADPVDGRGVEYRMLTAAGTAKPPFDPQTRGGGQNDRPDMAGRGGGHSDPGGADTTMSAEPSIEPSRNQPASNEAVAAAPPQDPIDADVERLCQLMSSEVRLAHSIPRTSREAAVASGWPGACRGLLTVDGYTVEQVEYAIRWVCRHHYWRNRVKSMTRLRSEMGAIANDLRRERERNEHLRPADGLSPSQRARLERTARRLAPPTNPTPLMNGGHLNGGRHQHLSDGRHEESAREVEAGAPRPSEPAASSGQ